MTRQIIPEGVALLKGWEALRLFSYPDPLSKLARATRGIKAANWGFRPARAILAELDPKFQQLDGTPWTLGYGHTGADVTPDSQCDEHGAEALLLGDLTTAELAVTRLCKVPLNDHQFAAVVSLVFNIGVSGFTTSTVLRDINSNAFADVPHAFSLWNEGTIDGKKQVDPGLVSRRQKEVLLWTMPDKELAIAAASENPETVASAATPVAPPVMPSKANPQYVGGGVIGVSAVGNWVHSLWLHAQGADLSGYHETLQGAADQLKPLIDYSSTIKGVFLVCSVGGVGLIVLDTWIKRHKATGVVS